MKKKFLSSILALTMLMVAFTPIMAEGSPTHDKQATVVEKTEGSGDSTITITSNSNVSGAAIVLSNSSVPDDQAEKLAKGVSSNYTYVTVFDLEAKNGAAELIKNNGVNVSVKVDGVKKGETYVALRFTDVQSEPTKFTCTVSEDGVVTINGITGCSHWVLVKDTSSSNSGSNSGTKVVTCEEANGKGWVWSEAKKACVYSVTNTSTK